MLSIWAHHPDDFWADNLQCVYHPSQSSVLNKIFFFNFLYLIIINQSQTGKIGIIFLLKNIIISSNILKLIQIN